MSASTLTVAVHNQQGLVYEGEVIAVSSVNTLGVFDILPTHANFITLIEKTLTLHLPNQKTQQFDLQQGVLECLSSQVKIYLDLNKITIN